MKLSPSVHKLQQPVLELGNVMMYISGFIDAKINIPCIITIGFLQKEVTEERREK